MMRPGAGPLCRRFLWAVTGLCFWSHSPALAFYGEGHALATDLAVRTVQASMPLFFSQGARTIQHCALDPDLFKSNTAYAALTHTESPDHYFDLEWFDTNELPPTRDDFFWACLGSGHSYQSIGTLPYAITEWTQRLTYALAEHRHWPDNTIIQNKCCIYAGLLAHYAQDACMPLHATIHYDGRAGANGYTTHTGIHAKVDALLTKLPPDLQNPLNLSEVLTATSVFDATFATIRGSHALVDRVYALEGGLPDTDATTIDDPEVMDLALTCLNRSVQFTAQLYLTAWHDSHTIGLPGWHQRAQE